MLPLPQAVYPYLALLRQRTPRGDGSVFPTSRRAAAPSYSTVCMSPTVFTSFVKTTFSKYTESSKGPNPSLLRSIFTTWLYGLQYDTEDAFLQEVRASSAKWKAHSEQMAATVYNKDLIYQHKAFAQLLLFCETYSERYAYDRRDPPRALAALSPANDSEAELSGRRRSSRKRRRETISHGADTRQDGGEDEYVVEALLDVRVSKHGEKQVRGEMGRLPSFNVGAVSFDATAAARDVGQAGGRPRAGRWSLMVQEKARSTKRVRCTRSSSSTSLHTRWSEAIVGARTGSTRWSWRQKAIVRVSGRRGWS